MAVPEDVRPDLDPLPQRPLDAKRPQSSIGQTFSIWIRGGGDAPFGNDIARTQYQVGTRGDEA